MFWYATHLSKLQKFLKIQIKVINLIFRVEMHKICETLEVIPISWRNWMCLTWLQGRQGSDGLLPSAYWCIILWMEVNCCGSLRAHSLIPCHGPCSSARLLLQTETSSQDLTYISMISHLISKGHLDSSNIFSLCLLCVKTGLYPYFIFFFRWNKVNPEFFLQSSCLLVTIPAALPCPNSLLNIQHLVLISSAKHHAIWISAY